MSTVQGNLIDHDGNKVAVNTLAAAVYDAAKEQALSATLAETPDKRALGYPTFSTVTVYAEGDVVFYSNTLWRFTQSHAAGAWNAEHVEAYSVKQLVADAKEALEEDVEDLKDDIEDGTVVPPLVENLKSWAERTALNVNDVWTDPIRTSGGDQSIDSAQGSRLVSIVAQTDFAASAFKTTGFNLLRNSTPVGSGGATGFYFPVPALPFGTYGTASEPNGILFTDKDGGKMTPTVRFKALSAGVPTSINDGDACAYTDSNGYRFYTCTQAGYIIVSGIVKSETCAHIAWSRRYDEYIATSAEGDAGGSVDLTGILAALHSDVNKMLALGTGAALVSDRVDFNGTAAVWTRKVGRVQPTWSRSDQDPDTGLYTFTATISGMKAGGLAEFETGSQQISVDGTTISYQSENGTASTAYVKYELATQATGSVTLSNALAIEDWGLEILVGATGTAIVTTQYAQSYPDAVAALAVVMDTKILPILSEILSVLESRIRALEISKDKLGNATADTVDANEFTVAMYPTVLWATGVPAANLVPDNLPEGLPWDGAPAFMGQIYIDLTANAVKVYIAKGFGAVSDWVVLN